MLPELLVGLPICRQLSKALTFVATLSLVAVPQFCHPQLDPPVGWLSSRRFALAASSLWWVGWLSGLSATHRPYPSTPLFFYSTFIILAPTFFSFGFVPLVPL